ncbi:hydrolase 1, exosortase A system-associated [Sphingosinithalassobacter sp. LHW66-3]|uniref:hydrolase 1, exosortase A system-associated n=1 Tax=Sphingosinithalassobacter sp. LHW66-3 TaxID=3424718 RepID=UPI003D6C6FC0
MRRLIAFPCAGETLVGTLDLAEGPQGLLIVSGGNELRMGAHRGMALLAGRVAAELGVSVFRFDRRGIGDSSGENRGFDSSRDDIAAAVRAFRNAVPRLERLTGLGNCDAASALALFHEHAGFDALILANPWTIEAIDDLPPAAAIRARYAAKLRDPREWLRLVRGGVDIRKLARGLAKASATPAPAAPARLAARLAGALDASPVPVTILLAAGDNTAIAFRDEWKAPMFDRVRTRTALHGRDTDSHSFAREGDKQWLFERVREALG